MAKILVAEDDKSLSAAYKMGLENDGFEVKVVGDGMEMLEAYDKFAPDVVLLDLVMPKMDGYAALERLGQDGRLGRAPVIVATNLGQNEDMDRVMALGASDYVIKSDLSMKGLISKIRFHLSSKVQPSSAGVK